MKPSSFWDSPYPVAIAHRGGLESAPENTIAAFSAAAALGYRYLESDVHLTADGVLVAFHDDRLDRVTDSHGAIRDLPFSAVSSALIGGHHRIPTLDELLETFPEVRFNLDVKSDDAVVPYVDAIRRHGAIERVSTAGFSDQRLRRLRSLLGPRAATVASPREVTTLIGVATLERGGKQNPTEVASSESRRRESKFAAVQVPISHGPVEIVNSRFVHAAHRRGLKVHVWTVDDPGEMVRLLDLGVDGLFTDLPSVLKDVLESRGQWV